MSYWCDECNQRKPDVDWRSNPEDDTYPRFKIFVCISCHLRLTLAEAERRLNDG